MSITNFSELYFKFVSQRNDLAAFLTGHLALEFLLRKLAMITNPTKQGVGEMGFYALVQLNRNIGTITENQCSVLECINRIRNKFSHEITYELTIDELKDLFQNAAKAFSDFTDGIEQGLDALSSANNVSDLEGWVIGELFAQIAYDIHGEYQDRGGDIESF